MKFQARTIQAAVVILTAILAIGCSEKEEKTEAISRSTLPQLISQIQKCSKLYTTEFKVHKIITYYDNKSITGSVLGKIGRASCRERV